MRDLLTDLWRQCLITADEAKTRSLRALRAPSYAAGPAKALQLDSLEPRILFSATPIDPAIMDGGDEAAMVATVKLEDSPGSSDFQAGTVSNLHEASPREIVIIDGGVDNIQQLLDDLHSSDRNLGVFILDSERDGIDQITQILDAHSNVDSLHIVSHGNDGEVRLGNQWLNEQNLAGYAGDITSWNGALSVDADILFYGCNLGASESGAQLTESLSVLTGADVAASDDVTGHASQGGNWDLEINVGAVETDIVFGVQLQQQWVSSLAGSRVSGTIFEDVNGNGDILDDGVGVGGVTVTVYLDDGGTADEPDAGDSFVDTDTTNPGGAYSITSLSDGTYWIVVDSLEIVPDAGFNTLFTQGDVWAEQTYGDVGSVTFDGSDYSFAGAAGAKYGGMQAGVSDDASGLSTAQHVTRVVIAGGNVTADYGFSFNAVSHVGDADHDLLNNRSSQGSLRQAVQNDNAIVGASTVQLPAGIYTNLLGAEMQVNDDLTIVGAGVGSSFVDGGGISRSFDVTGQLDVSGITIQNGGGFTKGGGVHISSGGQVTLNQVHLTGNQADQGAAIFNGGTLTATDVEIFGNTGPNNSSGGAIHNTENLSLNRVTLRNNTAETGGGLYVANASGTVNLTNVTISGNTAAFGGEGGGIWTRAAMTIVNSTIASNTATDGGGIFNDDSSPVVTITNTLIADNTAPTNSDVFGGFTSNGTNLIEDTAGGYGFHVNDSTGVDPQLDSLNANGGFTMTQALTAGSVTAIDGGTASGAPPLDQRGFSRSGATDIGAYEFGGVDPSNQAPVNSVPGTQNTEQDAPLVFSTGNGNQVSISDVDAGGANIEVTLTVTNGTVTLNLPSGATATSPTEDNVNVADAAVQQRPDVASDALGNHVVVWDGAGSGDSEGIFGQLFDSDGIAVGSEFRINPNGANKNDIQSNAAVAMSANGDFVVAWQGDAQDGSGYGIFAQRYNAAGVAQGGEISVNDYTIGSQTEPDIAIAANGEFVISWHGQGSNTDLNEIYARRFDAAGVAQGGQFQVNTTDGDVEADSAIAMNDAGDFVIVWETNLYPGGDTHVSAVVARLFNADGSPVDDDFQVNTSTFNAQNDPDVAMDAAGNFTVVWYDHFGDSNNSGIIGRQYNSSGTAIGGEFLANTTELKLQRSPTIAMNSSGKFVVAWESENQDGDLYGIFAQQFEADATKIGAEHDANTTTTANQISPAVAIDELGNFFVAWEGNGVGDANGTFHRTYQLPPPPVTFSVGDGAFDSNLTFQGTLGNINSILDGMLFSPTPDFTGTATIDIDVNDLGNTGTGGAKTDSDTITIDVTSNTPLTVIADNDAAGDEVAEDAVVGTAVGITALAEDIDAGDTVSYTLDDDAGGLFAIHATSGVVTVNGALDSETATAHNITVRATSTDTSSITRIFSITVTDVNEAGIGMISDSDLAVNSVAENSAVGTAVGVTAFADDPDLTDNVTYSLDDDDGGRFAIDATSGVVTVAAGLNAEAATSHNIVVRATSTDTSSVTKVFTINVTDVSEFDVNPISDNDVAINTVAEDAVIGAAVGITAFADDPDVADTVSYTLDNDAGGLFAIDAVSGVVTVNGILDAETATSHNITVRATSSDASVKTRVFSIAVTDVDEATIGTITDNDLAADSVAENSAVGTTVGITALADDPDVTDNVTYSLDDDAGGRFTIDSTTGVVTVNAALNAEAATSHNITVRATSDDTSFDTKVFNISVTDVDEFAIGPVSDSDATSETVAENAAVGTAVGITALADDADESDDVTYSLDVDAGGLFTIDSSTGIVTVSAALDAETATSHNITVRATSDDTTFSTLDVTITVTDVNEAGIGTISDSDAASDEVSEDAANGTAVGVTALAADPDVDDDITYSLDDDAGGRFAIDSMTGLISVANTNLIDFETDTFHDVTVRATSDDTSASVLIVTINVLDAPDTGADPISDSDASTNTVAENATVGATVGITAFSTDPDALDNITYSLDDDASGLFSIDSASGIVTVNAALDAETATSHSITVRATSDDTSFTTRVFAIAVTDVDESPIGGISDTDASADTVAENSPPGTTVGVTAFANDSDVSDNVTYSLDNDAGGRFAIHATTGVVTVIGSLDAETSNSHNITVRAISDDGTFGTQGFTITVTDTNEFNVGGISDTDLAADSVAENSAIGTAVGITALAEDADVTDTVTYSLDNDAGGRFAINGLTGEVTVNGALDFESSTTHNIIVRATSDDASFSTRGFTIAVTDVSESGVGPISDADGSTDSVAEASPAGTLVGITASATDPDPTDNVTYSLDDSAGGLFTIDAGTGVVKVSGSLDAETATSHSIIVRATSDDTSFSTLGFVISVADIDEFNVGPIGDSDVATNEVTENAGIGATVGITALATDADVGDNISYSLDDDAGGRFAIDAVTGVVTVNAGLDREANSSHNITVRATSDDASFRTRDFLIAVVDENDTTPVIQPNQILSVDENVSNATLVGLVIATDADTVGSLQNWSITAGNGDGIFGVDALTGALSVVDNTNLNFEITSSYTLSLQVDDGVNPSAIETVTVNINDVNDAPVVNDQAFNLDENSPNGTSVGIVIASDADVAQTVSYAIIGGTGQSAFSINAATGELTVANSAKLNFEATPTLTLTIRAIDDGSPALLDTAKITINLDDANDAPIALSDSYVVLRGNTLSIPATGLLANDYDEDGDSTTAILVSGAVGGIVTVNPDGSFTYDSDNVFFGVDSFTYKTNDGTLDGNIVTVTIKVLAGAAPPSDPDPTPDPDPDPNLDPDPDPTPDPDPDPEPVTPPADDPAPKPKSNSTPGGVVVPPPELDELMVTELFTNYRTMKLGITQQSSNPADETSNRTQTDDHLDDSLEGTLGRMDFMLMSQAGEMWDQMDLHRTEIDSRIQGDIIIVGAAGAAASTFTVGYVAWALRSGFILTGLLAQMPAWQSIDPLLIMQGLSGSHKGETLEEMMDRKAKGLKRPVLNSEGV